MKLFSVHCGFYDTEVSEGVYESHVNYFVVAESFSDARKKVKENFEYQNKKMHVDGIQEVESVDGYRILLEEDLSLRGSTKVVSSRHPELAPKTLNS